MKFSLRLNNDLPVANYVRLAQAAEAAGFDQFWVSDDLFLRSAVVILTAVVGATQRIQIGTCILNPYTIHPAEIAMITASLDEVSSGRFNLGISSGAAEFLKWIDLEPEKPLTAVKETVQVINHLLSGDRVPFQGQFLRWANEAYLRFTPLRRVPIYIGAMSPRMLRAIGEIADGGLPLCLPPEHYETILPYVQDGAALAGRAMSEIDIAACVWCSISDDRAAAEDALREKIAYYGHAMSPLIWERLGVSRTDFYAIERAAMVENDMPKAKALVSPAMLEIGILGTPYDLIARLEKLVAIGVRHLSLGPPLGPDPFAAVEAIGSEVIPYFRSKA